MSTRPRVLFVDIFAEPKPVGGNNTVFSHAKALQNLGYSIEILIWPHKNIWRGPVPDATSKQLGGVPYLCVERSGIRYHVVTLPNIWGERVLTDLEWDAAVKWSILFLKKINPSIVHLQHWQRLWYVMEASSHLDIPTIYSSHDYGIACLRTILVTGWNTLCDGIVEENKCSRCILAGRNLLGKANETLARVPIFENILRLGFGKNGNGPLTRFSGVRMPVDKRVRLTLARVQRILSQLQAVVVTSPFAHVFFHQFGVPLEHLHILPWFYTQDVLLQDLPANHDELRLSIVTRISPEKGVDILLDALAQAKTSRPVVLKIAGSINTAYAKALKHRFPEQAGLHKVIWCGWVDNQKLNEFYKDIHVAIVPSQCYDNTPLSLVEALAQGRPVICTDVPSMSHLVQHEVNGLLFPLGNVDRLARQIERLAEFPELIEQYGQHTRNVMSVTEYARKLSAIYAEILKI